MADLAELGIRIRSEEAAVADERLDDLAASAMRAEAATEQLGAASRTSGAGLAVMNSALRQQERMLWASRGAMGLTAAEGLNLSRQIADVGVTAAMGMNPLYIALQQGPQLLDIFQGAAIRTGATVTATMGAAATAVWTAMAPLLPFIAAAGAAAAVIGGTLALSTRSLNREFGDLTEGMGLTADQLENVQNRGVTMGDVVGGTLSYLRDIIWDRVGPAVNAIGEWFSSAMDVATRALIDGTKAITGGFIGSFRAVRAVWSDLPAVMGDLSVSAANATIRAVEGMINGSVRGINVVIGAARMLATVNPAFSSAQGLQLLSPVDLAEMGNRNAGAARAAGRQIAAEFAGGMADGAALVDRNLAALTDSILGAARDRIRGEAGDADTERAGGGSDRAARNAGEMVEHLERLERVNLRPLQGLFVDIYDTLEQTVDELRLIDDLTRDMARGLSSAFGETGRALGDLLTTMTGYEERLASIALAERENRLTGAQADRERAQAQIQSYGDMAAAARGFFREGSDGYRIMMAIEQAYRMQQLAGMLQEMIFGKQAAASSVADSMAKGAASTAAGAAKMFEALGPFAFPAVAAMLALLASLGMKGGGGGAARPPVAANDNGSPEASTAAVRAFSARDAQSRDAAASAIAARVDVRVTADREGLTAFVEGKAAEVAAPMTMQAAAGVYSLGQSERRQAARRARQSFIR